MAGGPGWLTDFFAAMMITVSVYCAGRLVAARRWRRTELDADGVHIVMGVAMAGVLAAGLHVLPARIWEAVFGAAAAWFAWQVVRVRRGASVSAWRCPHPLPLLVECAAMLYMFFVLASISGRGTAAGTGLSATESRFSVLALALAVFIFGYVAWLGDRLAARGPELAVPAAGGLQMQPSAAPATASEPAAGGAPLAGGNNGASTNEGHVRSPYLAPRCAAICRIATGITMGYMLILIL